MKTSLLDAVLENLSNDTFKNEFSNPSTKSTAIEKLVKDYRKEGVELTATQKDLIAIEQIDGVKAAGIHKTKESPVFGVIFFGPSPDDENN